MSYSEIISLFALGISAYCAFTSSGQYKRLAEKLVNKHIQTEFFAEYTRKYQELRVKWPNALTEKVDDAFYELYFDLCSEEFYLHKKGVIPDEVWSLWESGIHSAMCKEWFKTAWIIRGTAYDADGDFIHFMSNMQRQNH